MSGHFVTEFGHRIDFVPGYFERNSFYAHMAKRDWKSRRPYEGETKHTEPLGHYMLAKDLVLFSSLVDFLKRNGALRHFNTAIDLGGAEGTVIRLFRSCGFVENATNLDIVEFSSVADDAFFQDFIDRITGPTEWAHNPDHPVTDAIQWAKIHLDFHPMTPTLAGLVGGFKNAPDAQNIVANVYDARGSYDLIVANALLEFVDLDRALPKIRELMAPDGLFVGCLNFAWCPVIPSGLVGDFPYMAQRLSINDTRRYLEEHRPEQLFNFDDRYNYFHQGKQRPSLSQLIEHFAAAGLQVIAAERISPIRSKRYTDTPRSMAEQTWFNQAEVLRDVQHINPTVTGDDLMTTAVRIAAVSL